MQNVNAKVVWAFAGVLAAVALLLIGIWQLALVAILAAGGYLLAGLELGERWRRLMRRLG